MPALGDVQVPEDIRQQCQVRLNAKCMQEGLTVMMVAEEAGVSKSAVHTMMIDGIGGAYVVDRLMAWLEED